MSLRAMAVGADLPAVPAPANYSRRRFAVVVASVSAVVVAVALALNPWATDWPVVEAPKTFAAQPVAIPPPPKDSQLWWTHNFGGSWESDNLYRLDADHHWYEEVNTLRADGLSRWRTWPSSEETNGANFTHVWAWPTSVETRGQVWPLEQFGYSQFR